MDIFSISTASWVFHPVYKVTWLGEHKVQELDFLCLHTAGKQLAANIPGFLMKCEKFAEKLIHQGVILPSLCQGSELSAKPTFRITMLGVEKTVNVKAALSDLGPEERKRGWSPAEIRTG